MQAMGANDRNMLSSTPGGALRARRDLLPAFERQEVERIGRELATVRQSPPAHGHADAPAARRSPPSRSLDPNMILDDGIAARKSMLVAQPLENPLRRMTLLHRRCPVGLEDRLDHRNQRPQLRLRRRSLPHIARRHREPAHLRDCLSAQPKNTSRFSSALAIIENKLPNRRVNLHDKHPFGFPSSRGQRNALPLAGFYSAADASRAAPVAHFVSAAHMRTAGDLDSIIARYPVRESGVLGAIAKALRFKDRYDYERAALARVGADNAL